jgi:hypothetical protein
MVASAGSISAALRTGTLISHGERRSGGLDRAHERRGGQVVGIERERDPRDAGRDLLEHLQHLADDRELEKGQPGGVAAWPRQAGDEALPDRIGDRDEHDRDGAHLQGKRRQRRRGGGDDQVRFELDQLLGERPRPGRIAAIPAIVDAQVATLGPSELPERLLERRAALAIFRIVLGERHQRADASHALLPARREGPSDRRAAEERDELAAFHSHSITSSASASNLSGISRPRVLAVLRLMTSSSLFTCSTGKSAGLTPLRIRPA